MSLETYVIKRPTSSSSRNDCGAAQCSAHFIRPTKAVSTLLDDEIKVSKNPKKYVIIPIIITIII